MPSWRTCNEASKKLYGQNEQPNAVVSWESDEFPNGCFTYADDDFVERVTVHRIYIVATCDKDLKRRLRKIPGVPLISIKERKYQVERMPEGQFS